MTNKNITNVIFGEEYSRFKLSAILLGTVFLYIILWNASFNLNPFGLSLLVTASIVIIYRLIKIMMYKNVNKKKEMINLVITFIIFTISLYISIYYT